MVKKYLALLGIGLCTMFLVGCDKVRDLTDEETRLIAEYSAELLLKYDSNYIDRIDEGREEAKEMLVTTEQSSTVQDTESASEDISEEQTMQSQEVTKQDAELGTEKNIAAIAGVKGAEITFREYSIVERYPNSEKDELVYLDASDGYQLLVLQFDVVNTTDEVLTISMFDKELEYRAVCNGSKAANPMLTILMDDLGTLETTIKPEEKQNAVLVFQISDDIQNELETIDLYINSNDIDNVIKILQ